MAEDRSEFDTLTEGDWTTAVQIVTGLPRWKIASILKDAKVSFKDDGWEKCEQAVLDWRAAGGDKKPLLN